MAIIKQYHKDTDTTYVYESISYWDEEKKQSRSKRRVIGKLDPETGEIIPTGKRGRKKTSESAERNDAADILQNKISELSKTLGEKTIRVTELEHENKALKSTIAKLESLLTEGIELCHRVSDIKG